MPRLSARATRGLAFVLLAGLLSCGDHDPEEVDRQSAPLAALETVPLAGVLVADCASDGAAAFDASPTLEPLDPLGLVVLPPVRSVVGSDLGDLLVALELHEDDLPILAALVPASDDPTLWIPLPIDDALFALAGAPIPLETPVLGSTSIRCDDGGSGLGLIPLFASSPS